MQQITLSTGEVVVFDDADASLVAQYTWCRRPGRHTTYAQNENAESMHRVLMGSPEGMEIDHLDGDGLNNRRANLRVATRGQNAQNTPPYMGRQFKGVYQVPSGRWKGQIKEGDQRIHLGTFDTPEEAALAFDSAARRIWGPEARTNFPDRPCDACGSRSCGDFDLCDVSWDNYQPVPARHVVEAKHEIYEAYGVLDPIDSDIICGRLLELPTGGTRQLIPAEEITPLLRKGHTFSDVARAAEVPIHFVTARFVHGADCDTVLKAEAMLRSTPCPPISAIQGETGLTYRQVRYLAQTLGVKATRGHSYTTPEQVAEGWRLKDEGYTSVQIAPLIGMDSDTKVRSMFKRHPRPEQVVTGRSDGSASTLSDQMASIGSAA